MLSIFSLDNYKEHLISYYRYECDNNEIHKEKRKTILGNRYSDEYLLEIIHNTEEFIMELLEHTINNNERYITYEMFSSEKYIFTNCTGGWHPDCLIPISFEKEDKFISKHLLSDFLGENFRIDLDDSIEEVIDDEDEELIIGCIYTTPKMTITGDFNLLKEKYECLKKQKQEELVRVLKKYQNRHL